MRRCFVPSLRNDSQAASHKLHVIANLTSGAQVADRAVIATTLRDRLIGLLNRRSLEPGEAMVFPRCRSIHTWGMRFPIDVVFLRRQRVVKTLPSLRPWRLAWASAADAVIELPAGAIAAAAIQPETLLRWSEPEKKT